MTRKAMADQPLPDEMPVETLPAEMDRTDDELEVEEAERASLVPLEAVESDDDIEQLISQLRHGLTPAQVEVLIEKVEARVRAEKRIRAAVLSRTNYRDWVGQKTEGGEVEPYLRETGAVKLMDLFEVELKLGSHVKEKHDDGTYSVWFFGEVRARLVTSIWRPIFGGRWSGDPFFVGTKEKRKPFVDPGDIMKASLTNTYQRAVTRALGLESVTWDELKAAGVEVDRVPKIQYGSGGTAKERAENPTEITEDTPVLLVRMGFDNTNARDILKKGVPYAERRWDGKAKFWEVRYSPENARLVADLVAAHEDVAAEARNCPKDCPI